MPGPVSGNLCSSQIDAARRGNCELEINGRGGVPGNIEHDRDGKVVSYSFGGNKRPTVEALKKNFLGRSVTVASGPKRHCLSDAEKAGAWTALKDAEKKFGKEWAPGRTAEAALKELVRELEVPYLKEMDLPSYRGTIAAFICDFDPGKATFLDARLYERALAVFGLAEPVEKHAVNSAVEKRLAEFLQSRQLDIVKCQVRMKEKKLEIARAPNAVRKFMEKRTTKKWRNPVYNWGVFENKNKILNRPLSPIEQMLCKTEFVADAHGFSERFEQYFDNLQFENYKTSFVKDVEACVTNLSTVALRETTDVEAQASPHF